MNIRYGLNDTTIDVTEICLKKLLVKNIIKIPACDVRRSLLFSDPVYGVVKQIYIYINNTETVYDNNQNIYIDITDNTITTIDENIIKNKLSEIHATLKFNYGSLQDELPEQRMVLNNFTGNEKVLEIGGNLGRNSLLIGYILNKSNNNNFITLESNNGIAQQLIVNRDINNFHFHIENSALSKRKLIQKDWDTIVSDEVLDGYQPVNIISLEQLYSKYNIDFDTLVLDCEGAFYYILMDMPEILNNITLIIMENDYWELEKKEYIDDILRKNNFYRDYFEAGGWGPCKERFFEVWKKDT
jgi:FkbM family methyltransferase